MNIEANKVAVRLLFLARLSAFEPFDTFDDLVVYARDMYDVSDAIAKVAASTACAKSDAPLVKPNA